MDLEKEGSRRNLETGFLLCSRERERNERRDKVVMSRQSDRTTHPPLYIYQDGCKNNFLLLKKASEN